MGKSVRNTEANELLIDIIVSMWLILSIHVILLPLAMPYVDNDCFSFECVRLLAITDQWPLCMVNENGCRNDK